jgi:hypothetical protein
MAPTKSNHPRQIE